MTIVHASMRAAGTGGFLGGIWFKTECERGPSRSDGEDSCRAGRAGTSRPAGTPLGRPTRHKYDSCETEPGKAPIE
jgi:hypothetical protein